MILRSVAKGSPRRSSRERNMMDARSVIEVALPNPLERRAVLRQLLASSQLAETIAPGAWAVTLKSGGFRLNVGKVEVLTFWDDSLRLLIATDYDNPSLRDIETHEAAYKSIKEPHFVFDGTVRDYLRIKDVLEPLHAAYIRAAATTSTGKARTGSLHSGSHSPELIEYAKRQIFIEENSAAQPSNGQTKYREGKSSSVVQTRYESDPAAREACLRHYGYKYECEICEFNFSQQYGTELGGEYIHVHHIIPRSLGERDTNPTTDLIPVCPNCHAMLHRTDPPLEPAELRKLMGKG